MRSDDLNERVSIWPPEQHVRVTFPDGRIEYGTEIHVLGVQAVVLESADQMSPFLPWGTWVDHVSADDVPAKSVSE